MKKHKKWLVLGLMAGAVLVAASMLNLLNTQGASINSKNVRRTVDIGILEVAMGMYYKDHGNYPPGGVRCGDLSTLHVLIPYVGVIPSDREESIGHPPYQYGVSADGKAFVLKTTLDKNLRPFDREKLRDDLDGNVLGCNCDDPHYCLGSPPQNLDI